MKKRISLDQLRPGMYVIGMDQSWWSTPFILHHRLIKSEQEILKLRQAGVKLVEIDSSKGLDVGLPLNADVTAGTHLKDGEQQTGDEHSNQDTGAETIAPLTSFGFEPKETHACGRNREVEQLFTTDVNEQTRANIVRDAAIQAVEKIFEGVVTGVPIDYPLLQETAESVVRYITTHSKSMSQFVLLQNLRVYDKHLYCHVVDVCALTVVVGIEIGWSEDQLHELGTGALLHDIGYMRLPANLLRQRQRGLLTDSVLLNQHAELGVSLLKQCPEVPASIWRLVQEHHERLDGSGVPAGLKGSGISSASQLIGLVDRFDSMTSHWGGILQKPSALVLRELYDEAKSGLFDAHFVERMIRCLGIYPVGSFVELSTKERGLVTLINSDDLLRPVIKVISDENGTLYSSPFLVDLADANGHPPRTIKALLNPEQEGVQVGKYLSLIEVPA